MLIISQQHRKTKTMAITLSIPNLMVPKYSAVEILATTLMWIHV